ncbi:Uncharacterized protein BM_BM11025 [Brugia malayi]|uniref:von Hippel-Lindau disease tumour suppressor beta domain-containing protein n=1 Tax=Brugia malayi TaxID=6279 RepID=A0A4E9F0M2_BRUMA|nr:Uncharacterized protein BM_BM11025 [Brugia malayi]VIO89556.1 Uncharacterized protein BM_BM11025 [Brugia malayi]
MSSEFRVDSFIVGKIFNPGYRSVRSVEEVNIRFINNSNDTVDLCWIDFQGNLVYYLKLDSREVVKLTTFIGHYWVARFIRNGATAQFLPDRTEVFAITKRLCHTGIVFITQKVPTLFEAAVEHIGELFHKQQYALYWLPVPELIKFDIYFYIRRKRIYQEALNFLSTSRNLLRPNHNKQLLRIFANGQIDLCLQAVSDLSVECPDFEMNEIFLTYLRKEFVVMSFSTVCSYAKKWIDFLMKNTSGIRNHCFLLKHLICCTDLLQNKQLQLLLHEILPQAYCHLCLMKQYSIASVVAEVIFYSVALLAAYSDEYDRETLQSVWNKLLLPEVCMKSAHFNLCTVLVMSSLDFDCTQHMQCLENSLSNLKENDDLSLSTRKQFLILLKANLGILLSHCQPSQSEMLLNILIAFHLENNDLYLLIQSIFRHSRLTDAYASKVVQPFFRCLLLNLSLLTDENFAQQKGNVGIWIRENVVGILSISNKSYEDELNSWKIIMSSFIPPSHHTLSSDERFCQIVQSICGRGYSLKSLPVSLRVALFCVLISLIPCISSELFEIAIESTLSIMRSDTKLFRVLINSFKEKILKKYIKILLRCGCSNNYSKSTQILVKEFLLSGCSRDMLAVKSDAILKAAVQRPLIEEEYYFLKPLCDTFDEIHREMNAGENSALRISAEEIFQHVYGLVSPLDCMDEIKLSLFELSLSMLLVVKTLQDNDTTVTEEEIENIAEHVTNADQLCKALCKHPDRLIGLGIISEQMSQLLKRSILWMVKRGKLGHIISWKYVKYFEFYDESNINEIISIASVEMLKNLLHSSSHDLQPSKKFALYFALAKHQNEEKRKLLFAVLKDVLEIVVDIAGRDYLTAIDFLRHILPVATGSAYERDFVSFALAILAVNCESLSSNFVALRKTLSLLLVSIIINCVVNRIYSLGLIV